MCIRDSSYKMRKGMSAAAAVRLLDPSLRLLARVTIREGLRLEKVLKELADATDLPLKEFDLLEMLLRNAGRVLTRGQLIDRVWGADYVGDTKTLDVHIRRLRIRVEPDPSAPRRIQTGRGVGYRFADE